MKESEVHPHVPSERADLFTVADCTATENEYLELLYALIRVQKPKLALETGSYTGCGTVAIGTALKENGLGELVSLETNACLVDQVAVKCKGLPVGVAHCDSISYLNGHDRQFDFAFLDSHLPTRADELRLLIERKLLAPGALVVIHDTSSVREMPAGRRDPESVEFYRKFHRLHDRQNPEDRASRLIDYEIWQRLDFPLSRGMMVLRYNGD